MTESNRRFYIFIAGIFLLGCTIRLVSCLNTCVINQDGVLYIQQARALYYGEIRGITSSGLGYLSIYPFFIAGAFFLIKEWVASALAVSWFFGSAAIIPVFFLLRRFFDRSVTALGLLLFAVMPVFVDISCAVIKEPVAVFFTAFGFHFFLRHMENGGLRYLPAAGIFFLLASWARVESLFFFGISWLYLLFFSGRRWSAPALFLLPLAGLFAAVAAADKMIGLGVAELFRSGKMVVHFNKLFASYELLRIYLREHAFLERNSVIGFYMAEARNLLWFTAIGAMLKCLVKALFYPFVLFFAAGLPRAWRLARSDRRILYLAMIAAGSFLVLFIHQITYWAVYPRFMTSFILPAMFVLCCGIAAARDFLHTRLRIGEAVVVAILGLALVSVTFPKNTRARECDKLVFKQIGESAAMAAGKNQTSMIAASAPNQRWVAYFANTAIPGPFPPELFDNHWGRFPKKKENFVAEMYKRGINFILWDERHWVGKQFTLDELLNLPGVRVTGRWSHPDTGEMILLKIPEKGAPTETNQR